MNAVGPNESTRAGKPGRETVSVSMSVSGWQDKIRTTKLLIAANIERQRSSSLATWSLRSFGRQISDVLLVKSLEEDWLALEIETYVLCCSDMAEVVLL